MPKICAGITVFEPEYERLRQNVLATLKQVEKLYIIDNASSNTVKFEQECLKNEKIKYIRNEKNVGIATALNQMCEEALDDGFEYILTLDQDSLPEPDLTEKYLPYLGCENVAMWTPNFYDDNESGLTFSDEEEYTFVDRCNTSACLVLLSAYRKSGGFDDKMFIDCVDFDFCTTLLENGYKILRVNKAILHHRLGEAKKVTFFIPFGKLFGIKKLQKPLYTYNHSPLRTYYYARNIRYYAFKHKDFIDLKKEKKIYLKWLVLKIGFEKQKIAKIKAILKGKKDARKMTEEFLKNKDK